MSRRSRQLQKVFGIQVSEGKLRGLSASARARAVEAATRRLERGISEDTAREVEQAEERAAKLLEQRQKKQEKDAKDLAAQHAKREREEARQQHARCSCRRPNLDAQGKCRRCKKFPAGKRR